MLMSHIHVTPYLKTCLDLHGLVTDMAVTVYYFLDGCIATYVDIGLRIKHSYTSDHYIRLSNSHVTAFILLVGHQHIGRRKTGLDLSGCVMQ